MPRKPIQGSADQSSQEFPDFSNQDLQRNFCAEQTVCTKDMYSSTNLCDESEDVSLNGLLQNHPESPSERLAQDSPGMPPLGYIGDSTQESLDPSPISPDQSSQGSESHYEIQVKESSQEIEAPCHGAGYFQGAKPLESTEKLESPLNGSTQSSPAKSPHGFQPDESCDQDCTTSPDPQRHPCNRCFQSFKRKSDLRRHFKVHFPSQRTFQCDLPDCDRIGQNGFYRRDKLRDHQRQVHRLE